MVNTRNILISLYSGNRVILKF